ncbi:hypothetical protein HPG69_010199 [Diceros bicornis minor]|uniref:palmitoyl-protein hydrolase n=1 Tax=Diceros bicornis minor TaxID=77932 RepID=A0A7J7EE11_DICBM|nr:hypothetical protein HPG69_010199 [Diceros bicornis minor]
MELRAWSPNIFKIFMEDWHRDIWFQILVAYVLLFLISEFLLLLGGFSMGGCMAMHLAYRSHQDVAGVFALSSFLNKTSAVYQALQKSDGVLPELFQCHGTADELVLHSWGEETNSMLKSLGVSTKFHSFPGVYHELSKAELEKLKSWILTKLPGEMERQNE